MMAGIDEPDSGAILQAAGVDGRLSSAGRPHPRRPHRLRRSLERLRPAPRHQGRDARARRAPRRSVDSRTPSTTRCCRATAICRIGSGCTTATRSSSRRPPCFRASASTTDGLRASDRDVLRRLADAHRAGEAAARPAEPAAARRADQPSRSRSAQLARNLPERLSARGHPGQPRSLLPRRRRHANRRPDAAHLDRLRRQLQRLPGRASRADRSDAQGQARAGRGGRARQDVHRSVPLPGDQGVAGPEPHQDAREGGADRSAARAEEDSLRLSDVRQERPHRARAEAGAKGLRRSGGVRAASTCTSSAAIGSRWSAPTAPASRR